MECKEFKFRSHVNKAQKLLVENEKSWACLCFIFQIIYWQMEELF